MDNYGLLIQKLDAFIRKFYLNQLLRGSMILLACALSVFLILNISEYYFYLPSFLKITLLSVFSIGGVIALYNLVIQPLLKMQRLGKIISHDQAAHIIGKHFNDIEDKLLNVLQLQKNNYESDSRELVEASIRQKSAQIMVVPFLKAINLNKNKKYLPYILPALLLIVFILFAAPDFFKTATGRLMQPATNFAPPPPFSFSIMNKSLKVPLNGNYTIDVEVKGEKLPEQVFVAVENELLQMEKKSKQQFSYTFQHVNRPLSFHFEAAQVKSDRFMLSVMEKPLPEGFKMDVIYPAYTGLKNEEINGLSDITVPEGTQLKWSLKAKYTDEITMKFGSSAEESAMPKKGRMEWNDSRTIYKDTSYTIYLSNKNMPKADSFIYHVNAIEDQHPRVLLQRFQDSISGQQIVLDGQASDDYGLTHLYFNYTVLDEEKNKIAEKKIALKKPTGKIFTFQHYVDLATIHLAPGQQIDYFVEVWDNDGIRGSKRGQSETFSYRMPDKKELDDRMKENMDQINQNIANTSSQSKEIKKEMEKMQTQLLQNQHMSWEQEQNMKSILERQTRLKDQVTALKNRFEEQKKQSEQKNFSEQIQEKQEALEEQIDNLLNKELAEQLKKLQDLLEQRNKANAFENLQKMQEQNKLFEMNMERIQELMKKLEMQMKIEDMADKLSDLAKEERALEEKTAHQDKSNAALSEEQKSLKKTLDKLMKEEFAALEKANREQSAPQSLEDAKQQAHDAESEMQKSMDQLQQNNSKNAKNAQDKAAGHLEKMAAQMMQMAAGMEMEQIDIDIKAVRQLLTNLIRYSFEQEALMEKEKTIPITSPLFVNHAKEQNKLKDNARMIKDSLFALSKRIFQLAPTINKESAELTNNINKSLASLELRRVADARVQQQYAMANANNLALLLNETLSNLMQMQAQMNGEGEQGGPPQPGQGKPGKGSAGDKMKDIITGQQQLGEGLSKAQQGQGKQEGSSGENGEGGDGGSESEKIARLAQQQAQLRRQIQELSSMLNSSGFRGNYAKELQQIQEQMDKNETDLVNRRFNPAMMQRQQDILTRLLEAEKSIRNQEEDDKRTANAGKDLPRPVPAELQQYLKNNQDILDTYKTSPATLTPFYQKMSEVYLKQLQN